jgi:ribonucleotide monophosphatase NagD (HAD superfamily)
MNRIKKINYSMIKGIILDIDGTLTHDGSAIKGAVDVIANLRKSNFKLRFVTNTTGRSPEQIQKKFRLQSLHANITYLQTYKGNLVTLLFLM